MLSIFKDKFRLFKKIKIISPKESSIAAKLKIKNENEINNPSSIIVLIILQIKYNITHISSEIKIKKKKLYVLNKNVKKIKKKKKLKKFTQLNIKKKIIIYSSTELIRLYVTFSFKVL